MAATSTALATYDPKEHGSYLALTKQTSEIADIVSQNLGGQDVAEFDLRRVGMPAGGAVQWQVPGLGGIKAEETLDGILVFTKQTRSYWAEEQKTGERPRCSSIDGLVGVGDPGGDCKTCPYAKFGSKAPKPGQNAEDVRAQACTARTVWFMLRQDSFLPIVVSLSPASLKAAKQYMLDLSGAGLMFNEVITSIRLEADLNPDGERYARGIPTMAATLDPETAEKAKSYAAILRPILEQAAAAIASEQAGAETGKA